MAEAHAVPRWTSPWQSERPNFRVDATSIQTWWARQPRHDILFALFAGSIILASIGRIFASTGHPLILLCSLAGGVSCGWGWLYARSLFGTDREGNGGAVAAVLGVLGLLVFYKTAASLGVGDHMLPRLASNLVSMVGSTFIVLTLVESVRHFPSASAPEERRFRALFAAGYIGLIVLAVLLVDGAEANSFPAVNADSIQTFCAFVALGGAWAARQYRSGRPLTKALGRRNRTADHAAAPTAEDERLAQRIQEMMDQEELYLVASLKVSDVAARLHEQDYKVTRAITGVLGYANFNRFVNVRRIDHVCRRLADPAERSVPILTMALEAGFGSIGPFNRAFRDIAGMTPREFRLKALGEHA